MANTQFPDGSKVFVVAPHSILHATVVEVVQTTHTGRVQVRGIDGQLDLFSPEELRARP